MAGLAFVIGLERTFRFFFQKHKVKATGFFLGGVFVVLIGWPLIGMIFEIYGFFLLFRWGPSFLSFLCEPESPITVAEAQVAGLVWETLFLNDHCSQWVFITSLDQSTKKLFPKCKWLPEWDNKVFIKYLQCCKIHCIAICKVCTGFDISTGW